MNAKRRDRLQTAIAVVIVANVIALALFLVGHRIWKGWIKPDGTPHRMAHKPRAESPPLPAEPFPEAMLPLDQTVAEIDPAKGGTLSATGGTARLSIPPGAVGAPTAVVLARLQVENSPDPLPLAFDLRPEGLRFVEPAHLEIPLPPGVDPGRVEIAVFDPGSRKWVPELIQQAGDEGRSVIAALAHFSLRRIRIRPGMDYALDPGRVRAGFFLTSDAEATFERYLDGRWQAVERRSPAARELLKIGRMGRHSLILSGRLRAVIGPSPANEPLIDSDRAVTLPEDHPLARTGWVKVRRLDEEGNPMAQSTPARVIGVTPVGMVASGVAVRLSRGALEALGWRWEVDFGVSPALDDQGWLSARSGNGESRLAYFPVAIEASHPPGG